MMTTDPIADFLTRIRNGQRARHAEVSIPMSKTKAKLAEILKREGFITYAQVKPATKGTNLHVGLRYELDGSPLIREIKRISTPGCRRYTTVDDLSRTSGGITTTIISTSKGILTDREAREAGVGGEIVCRIS